MNKRRERRFDIKEIWPMTEGKTLSFLYNISTEIGRIAEKIENQFFQDPQSVTVNGRLILEELLKLVYEKENQFYYEGLSLQERIDKIGKLSDIDEEIIRRFHWIRKAGNKGAHEILDDALNQALFVHKNLYEVAKWYLEVFGEDVHFQAPTYEEPNPPIGTSQTELEQLIKNKVEQMLQGKVANTSTPQVPDETESWTKSLVLQDGAENNSYFLKQLRRLEESSKEAVEGSDAFSHFKEYMHVERLIQQELLTVLEKTHTESHAHLVLLCGSVGDGKSHLLAYMNSTYPSLLNYFSIHNDATESFDPQKNSLDTLSEVLYEFRDDQINQSSKKLILAINLGVLNNFLESEYAKDFTKLKEFVLQTNVFDGNKIVQNNQENQFSLLSFSDYHLFELTDHEPKSEYFAQLLAKITATKEENPFYVAYQLDKAHLGETHPIMMNYRWLQKKHVQEVLIQLLIRATIQYKLIISTRTLLNFIHDIIVPANLSDYEFPLTPKQIVETNLLSLLFRSPERSTVLKVIHQLDPIHIRHQRLDELLIELNSTPNVELIVKKYFHDSDVLALVEMLFHDADKKYNKYISLDNFFIRLAFFFDSDWNQLFYPETYKQYLKDLYHYNRGEIPQLINLYKNIEVILFEWKGSPEQGYLYIEQISDIVWMAQKIHIKPKPENMNRRTDTILYRFTENIFTYFEANGRKIMLELDYPLYELIQRILNGYRPNKKDKENAIKFVEFIDSILSANYGMAEVIFYDKSREKNYVLSYSESFGTYEFGRKM